MSTLKTVASTGILVLAAAGAGFLIHRLSAGEGATSLEGRINAAAVAATATPTHLPAISLPDIAGRPRPMSEWRGRPLLINFWATWCEPCRREIPLLRRLRADHARDGLEVVGIAVDFREAVAAYVKEAGMEYPVLIAEEDATAPKAFGVGMGLPTTVVADRQGRIVGSHVGELSEGEAERLLSLVLDKP